jgi:cytochrome d ubiquinol oxidase subunit I
MDVVLLSRLQFAAATMFHFLFVPLTLGLSTLVAYMETQYVRTGDETYLAMTKFWGKLFLINFVVGVVTGITLEFQFGTNWSGYSAYVGDIFGSLLAIEATAAFFLESTMIGVWIFGWNKLSKKAHATVMWLIAGASTLSAVWILIANGWMQQPVGFDLQNGRAELVSFFQVVFNKFGWMIFLHVIAGAFVLTAFFVMGISAYHLLKRQQVAFFTRSFKIALVTGFAASVLVAVQGDFHAAHVAEVQPAKLAAMETLWETQPRAPIYLFSVPDEKNEANLVEFGKIPGLLSFLAFKDVDAEVRGLKAFPREERPPVFISSLAFKGMVGLGTYFILITLVGLLLRNRLTESPLFLKIMMFSIPLPYIANEFGWILAEVGRQPWIVYGMMKTADAASPVDPVQVAISLAGFVLVYGLLGAAGFYLMAKNAIRGPEPVGGEV